jgi:type I restriction enzyme M protein
MLREMRDAAGDSGEFYTPRPVVRFMVQVMRPAPGRDRARPGLRHGRLPGGGLRPHRPAGDHARPARTLQRETLFGQEAKPLPYMLAQMNLLLHGLEAPQIAYGNTLDRRINEIGHSERVDVILTNPPFGGEEEVGIKANFPPNMQTAETALLFLQYIMRKLRVAGARCPAASPPRAAAARPWSCPTAPCSATASAPSSRRRCSRSSACTPSCACRKACSRPTPTSRPTCCSSSAAAPDTIWYYELPLPEGRKKYSKTAPLQFEEFAAGAGLVERPREGPQAWKVDFAAKRAAAVEAATPHWQRAEAERNAAIALGKPIRELEQAISAAANGDKAALQDRLRALKAEQQAHEQAAKAAQAEGDALYWPIYNLDLKNPMPRRAWNTPTRRT